MNGGASHRPSTGQYVCNLYETPQGARGLVSGLGGGDPTADGESMTY